jgi:hypothetical protein
MAALLALLVDRLRHRDEQAQRDGHGTVDDQLDRLET